MRKSVKRSQSLCQSTSQRNKKDVQQSTNPKPQWRWFAGAAILIVAFAAGHHMIEMRKRLASLEGELGRMSEAAGRARAGAFTLKQELERTKAERGALQGQLVKATSRINHLMNDIAAAEAALDAQPARFASVQNQVEGAGQTEEQPKTQATGIGALVVSLKTEVEKGSGRRSGLLAKIASWQSDVERLRTQLVTSQSQLSRMRDHLTKVEAALQGSTRKAEQAAAEAAALKNQTATLKTEFEASRAQRDTLRRKLDQTKAYIEQLKDASLNAPLSVPGAAGAALESACEARDYLIRTIVFEGSGETEIGKIAIGYVVLNRKRSGRWGDSMEDVVTSPWQFEPWMTRRKAIKKLAATDPRYKDAARVADKVLMGAVADPTEGATHFLNPVIVRHRRGGTLPAWARGEGQPIGRHVFYAPNSHPTSLQQSDVGRRSPTALYHQVSQVAGAG
jgi:N-acetylmuramoyl-L-alanine amidase